MSSQWPQDDPLYSKAEVLWALNCQSTWGIWPMQVETENNIRTYLPFHWRPEAKEHHLGDYQGQSKLRTSAGVILSLQRQTFGPIWDGNWRLYFSGSVPTGGLVPECGAGELLLCHCTGSMKFCQVLYLTLPQMLFNIYVMLLSEDLGLAVILLTEFR